jgi:hypothetical protein
MHQSFEESLLRYVSEYRSLIDHSNAFRLHFSSLSTIKRLCQVRLTWVVKYQRTWNENPCKCSAINLCCIQQYSIGWLLLFDLPGRFPISPNVDNYFASMLCLVWECSVYLYVRLHCSFCLLLRIMSLPPYYFALVNGIAARGTIDLED